MLCLEYERERDGVTRQHKYKGTTTLPAPWCRNLLSRRPLLVYVCGLGLFDRTSKLIRIQDHPEADISRPYTPHDYAPTCLGLGREVSQRSEADSVAHYRASGGARGCNVSKPVLQVANDTNVGVGRGPLIRDRDQVCRLATYLDRILEIDNLQPDSGDAYD